MERIIRLLLIQKLNESKTKKNIKEYGLTQNTIYEVCAIQYTRETKVMKCGIQYYIYNDPSPENEESFDIVDETLDDDFVVKNVSKIYEATYIMPKCVDTSMFHAWILYRDEVKTTKDFARRFNHLVLDYKYAKIFPELYQNPNIKDLGEDLEDNWIMCPNCSEVYEVTKELGYIECKNATCKIRFNNPNAKKFPIK